MSEGRIRVECDCGKAARVPARFAGRQVKCGGCGGSLRIPDPDEDGEEAEDPEEDEGEGEDPDQGEDLRAKAPKKRTRTGGSKTGTRGTGRAPVRSKGGRGARAPSRGKGRTGSRVGSSVGGKRGAGSGVARRRRSSEEEDDPYAPSRAVLRDSGKGRGRGKKRARGDKRLLGTEGHICAIGIWNVLGGLLYLGLGLILLVSAGSLGAGMGTLGGLAAMMAVVCILLGAAALGIGVGLMKRQAWARLAYTVVQVLTILAQVAMAAKGGGFNIFGLAYTIAIFATLYGQNGSKVFSRGYLQSIQGDRRPIPWAASPFFWLPLVLLGLLVALGVALAVLA